MKSDRFQRLLVVLTVLLAVAVHAQARFPGGRCYLFRLKLADKQGTPYSTLRPQEFLSQRAIDRRARQGIAVDSTDLPLSPDYLRQIEATDVEVVSRSKWNNTVLVRSKKLETLRALTRLSFVVEGDRVWTSPDSVPHRQARSSYRNELTRWDSLAPHYEGAAYEQLDMLGGARLHLQGYRGRGLTIAVLDGGFMNADVIPALADARVLGTADFAFPRCENIYKETDHGTKVLSTMAACVPEHFVGTAPEASYWLLRTEETQKETPAEEDFWAEGVEFADSAGVDIISSSLGYHNFDEPAMNYRYAQLDGHASLISHTASMLADKGIVLVSSAGNDGMGTWKKINVPADAFDILTVGALSADGHNAAFSSVGPTADGRVKPDVMALGSPAAVINGRGVISKDLGTSFSTPIVAGLVACLWQAFPQKTAREIMDLVRRSGNNAQTPDNIFGYGLPDFWKAYNTARAEAHRN